MYTTDQIRSMFLNYFKNHEHTIVSSSSLIPAEDPTLLFVNAGMVQFKNTFLGLEGRDYLRATSSQKCLRISGKHNDFEAVGRTPRHHTFFEMLGNFSFGDYFKKEAITYAWDFITNELKLPKDKIWVSVYEEDEESKEIWLEATDIEEERIVKMGAADNFWSMGDVGPCGPCTEIHYDKGESFSCGPECGLGKCECDRYMEIWNLVFMQYNRDESGILTPLPKPSVDTGMGLERVVSVMQGVDSNYDIDIFTPLLDKVSELSGVAYDRGDAGFPFRVIADHIRSSSFLIADGILPSNDGRGYILRRILRRAIRFGKVLGIDRPFLHQLVDVVVATMGKAYPELVEQQDFIKKVISVEEERFLETLEEGLSIVERIFKDMQKMQRQEMTGEEAFSLYDTYGFPVELTEDFLKERGFTLNRETFNEAMERQKEVAKGSRNKEDALKELELAKSFLKLDGTQFTGYEGLVSTAQVLGLYTVEGSEVLLLKKGNKGILVVDKTPFYGESGGQVGDTGYVVKGDVPIFRVVDTRKSKDGRIYHLVEGLVDYEIDGDLISMVVDEERRRAIMRNHSATHLLHRALHEVLGSHASQKGSYVTDTYLRFDFSHYEVITREELREIELKVNEYILGMNPVMTENLKIEEAKKKGATAIFGEKYGDEVRVVTMGDVSMEFCGGTHVGNTGEIGSFKITSEGSIGAGLRRIEGKTGLEVIRTMASLEDTLEEIRGALSVPMKEIGGKVLHLLKELKEKNIELSRIEELLAARSAEGASDKVEIISGIPVIIEKVEGKNMDALRTMADKYRDKLGSVLVLLASVDAGKVNLLAAATKDLKGRVHAGKLVGEMAKVVGGGGGGREDMAQAGGKNPEKVEEAFKLARDVLSL